jgi:hypothetical protein
MSFLGRTHLITRCTVESADEAALDRLLPGHAGWMPGHTQGGETALLSYTLWKGPEQRNPLNPMSAAPKGRSPCWRRTYESPRRIERLGAGHG